jgi:hypothetical protein
LGNGGVFIPETELGDGEQTVLGDKGGQSNRQDTFEELSKRAKQADRPIGTGI